MGDSVGAMEEWARIFALIGSVLIDWKLGGRLFGRDIHGKVRLKNVGC